MFCTVALFTMHFCCVLYFVIAWCKSPFRNEVLINIKVGVASAGGVGVKGRFLLHITLQITVFHYHGSAGQIKIKKEKQMKIQNM